MVKKVFIPCRIASLPESKLAEAARVACAENPANMPLLAATTALVAPDRIAFFTGKYWGAAGVKLSVSFLDNAPAAVRDRILSHMNAWGQFANVQFAWSQSGGDVRINRGSGGYWSYLGTDIRLVGRNQATMNLQGFSANTPESEYLRVVRHETGHTLGCPHEHLREAVVRRLDVAKTLEYFRRTQGWDETTTRSNVLTPLSESSIMGSESTDEASIMCYQLPGSITRDGRPVPGGSDFTGTDRAFAARVYPRAVDPPGAVEIVVPKAGTYVLKT